MTRSPLQFARDFARLQSQLGSAVIADQRLLMMVDFWPEISEFLEDAAYRSYFDEYLPLLFESIEPTNLVDLGIAELDRIRSVLAEIQEAPTLAATADIQAKLDLVTATLAKIYFYVGAVEEGLAALSGRQGDQLSSSRWAGAHESLIGGIEGANEIVALQAVCARASEANHPLAAKLSAILTEWQSEREALYHDRAKCLFVERDDGGKAARGRMRTLVGNVELFRKSATTDEITFQNEIKTPDDPFVGVAYDALQAVRRVFNASGMKAQGSHYYHAHYSIEGSDHTFTGDSLGLAFALITYTQLLKPEVLRLERCLSGEVAFTGGIDADGRLAAVNDETLSQKIERAFFAPIRYVVLPRANLETASRQVEALRAKYPRRRLHLVAGDTLNDIIEDHNVVRSEKVCIGEFVAKKAAKYGKMTKVQVPLLAVLGYLLVCLIYPKAWVGFDWKIDRLEIRDKHFDAISSDGHVLWCSSEFATPLNPAPYAAKVNGLARAFYANDFNNDRKDELFFLPTYSGDQGNSTVLQFYDSKGSLVWFQPTFIRTTYPGDTASMGYDQDVKYSSGALIPIQSQTHGSCVLVFSCVSTPYRFQLLLFNAAGQIVAGPYLNTGQFAGENARVTRDINSDGQRELILGGTNNRYGRASLLVIDPTNLSGVSPPYDNELFLASHMPKGSQLRYVAFPKTELSKGEERRNWVNRIIVSVSSPLSLEVAVVEGSGSVVNGLILDYTDTGRLPSVTYRLDSNFVPLRAFFADNDFDQFNSLLRHVGKEPYSDRDSLCRALVRDVVVYWGDSIVYHPANGIDFHSK